MKAAFYTLGCKVNQYESQVMAQQFQNAGFETVPWPGPADVLVVNSCTVTAQGEKKALQLLRRLRREQPEALMLTWWPEQSGRGCLRWCSRPFKPGSGW